MKNKRRNNLISATIWLVVFVSCPDLFVFAQKLASMPIIQREKLVLANKLYREADALFERGTADSYRAAREKYNAASALFAVVGRQQKQAESLAAIGRISDDLGEKNIALENYKKVLTLFRSLKNTAWEVATLNNIGGIFDGLGDKRQALKYYNSALPVLRRLGDKSEEAKTLNNIGKVYADLGNNQQGLKYFNYALLFFRQVNDEEGKATTLNNIATVYGELGDNQRALKFLLEALTLRRAISDKSGEATTLNNIGTIYDNLGEKEKALAYYNQSLPLFYATGDKSGLALTFSNLMFVWESRENTFFATFYGKQSVNVYQELRSNVDSFDRRIQRAFLKSIEKTYRLLANILIAQGRIAEAEQVLGMLKEEEYFDFLRRDDKVAGELKAKISLTPDEAEAFANYEKLADKITGIGKEFGELEAKRNALPIDQSLAAAEQARFDELKKQLADANRVFNVFLDELKVKFGQKDVRVATVESDTQGILKRLKEPRTAIISTVAGEDKLSLIVTTADVQRAHTVDIKAADLNRLVSEFREAVKNPNIDPHAAGKKLYDVLFPADLQKDLDGIKADTIVWSLDGTLRYAPIAALWDGKQYLVERYATAVLTLASRDKIVDLSNADRTKWLALGVGVSKRATVQDADGTAHNFPALIAVPEELCGVVADPKKRDFCGAKTGVMKGVSLFDDEFTLPAFENYLGRTPVVHIASHFSLNAGNEADSYLLLGGKPSDERKFTVARMKNETNLTGVELLTLSACNTAMTAGEKSNGVEIEGFGALAQNKGAKSVLASLWSVADDSTRDLMIEFYRQLETNPNVGKAEALRAAQLKLMRGKNAANTAVKGRRSDTVDVSGEGKAPEFKRDDDAPFAHPFYWSPFILFGNWR